MTTLFSPMLLTPLRSSAALPQDAGAGVAPAPGAGLMLTGTAGNDTMEGSAQDDHVVGLGGNDNLSGLAGNDYLDGGEGNDVLNGGGGNDQLNGGEGLDSLFDFGSGNSTLRGGGGNDYLQGGRGDSVLEGGDGDDSLSDGIGNDTLDGGAGDDRIFVAPSFDNVPVTSTVFGGAGNDVISIISDLATKTVNAWGGSGIDIFGFGGRAHAETIIIGDFAAGIGGDQLRYDDVPSGINPFGAAAYLRLVQSGNDTLFQLDEDGAAGSAAGFRTLATLRGVSATDVGAANIASGYNPDGSDSGLYLLGTNAADTIDGGTGDDTMLGSLGDDRLAGGTGNDQLQGGGGNDELDGEEGNDMVDGGSGADWLWGSGGSDTLNGGSGDDTVDGGSGDDELIGGDGNDFLRGMDGADTLSGGNGNDKLYALDSGVVLDGGAGDDTLSGGDGGAQMNGGNGNDYLTIRASGDSGLFGAGGRDIIEITSGNGRVVASGGADDDTIIFHPDYYTAAAVFGIGGAGVDSYQLRGLPQASSFVVKDFSAGSGGDRIDLTQIPHIKYGNPLESGVVRLVQSGTSTLVQVDIDGAGGSDAVQLLMTLQNVVATTLTIDNFLYTPATGASAMAPVQLLGLAPDNPFAA